MLLNLIVKGKGSFTILVSSSSATNQATHQPTNNITAKKRINPAHNQRIRNNHGHLVLHHAHHAVHRAGIAQGIRRRLSAILGVLEVCAGLICSREHFSSRVERALGERVEVGSDLDAVEEGALLADGLAVLFLGRGLHEDCGIVS